uniref:Augmin subunit 6 n=1 Tax=Tanacetum cinerariifolium TaxID=118510 RepID=A0A6L2L387_TANCI|nr:augmin subunit 6 [Tanacetum cinerariifolium]
MEEGPVWSSLKVRRSDAVADRGMLVTRTVFVVVVLYSTRIFPTEGKKEMNCNAGDNFTVIGEPCDELVSSSSQNSYLVQRATRWWDSLLSRKSQHEVLASGLIEDLIAHQEYRYRISGSSLLAPIDESTQVSYGNPYKDQADRSQGIVYRENVDESLSTSHSKPTMKNLLRLMTEMEDAKANDGEGPDLLRSANDGGTNGHATTLAEHRQHLASIQDNDPKCWTFIIYTFDSRWL